MSDSGCGSTPTLNEEVSEDDDDDDNYDGDDSDLGSSIIINVRGDRRHVISVSRGDDVSQKGAGGSGYSDAPHKGNNDGAMKLDTGYVGFSNDSTGHEEFNMKRSYPFAGDKDDDDDGGSRPKIKEDNIGYRMMTKLGYEPGRGLGADLQGRVDPVEESQQQGRRGLGHATVPREFARSTTQLWDYDGDDVSISCEGRQVEWLDGSQHVIPELDVMEHWMVIGQKDNTNAVITSNFCDDERVAEVVDSKSAFDHLVTEEMVRARTKSNPFETLRGCFFLNRAAMKMAEIDAVTGFAFTEPRLPTGHSAVAPNQLLYFADVCAGPGGFSEYVLWRKQYSARGFGFTLKDKNDFKLDDFLAAPCETFEPCYGPTGDGDITKPENLLDFRRYVMEVTGNEGIHFVMADGGFSVEGNENLQEVLSKQLYLCQFCCALSIIRPGGSFVCKLFDVFTDFSVGLIYLMYLSFSRVSLFKPCTSRPANSERYLICQGRKSDEQGVSRVHDYLLKVNEVMGETFASSVSDEDVTDVVPLYDMLNDSAFLDYVRRSNELLSVAQCRNLKKIQTFVRNKSLHDPRQASLRERCLNVWQIPDQPRMSRPNLDANTKFMELTSKVNRETLILAVKSRDLQLDSLSRDMLSIYDFRCVVLGGTSGLIFLMSLGRSKIYSYTQHAGWVKFDKVRIELPSDTLVVAEVVTEYKGLEQGQRRMESVHLVDALYVGGRDVSSLGYPVRMEEVDKLCRALYKPSSHLASVRCKETIKPEDLHDLLANQISYRTMKGMGNRGRQLCYHMQADRYLVPSSLLFTSITRKPWAIYFSNRHHKKYFFNLDTGQSTFESPPNTCFANFCDSTRLLWRWDLTVRILQQQERVAETSKSLSAHKMLSYISGKIGRNK